MKLSMSQILEAWDALGRLGSEKFPVAVAFKIQRNMNRIERERTPFLKSRDALIIEKYAVGDEKKVADGREEEFREELRGLLEVEVEVDIVKLQPSDVKEITPIDLLALEWMFDFEAISNKPPDSKKRKR